MGQGHIAVVAKSPVPPEAFEKHPNQWIAIRDGNVVAAADDYDELVARSDVRRSDTLYHVPSSSTYFY
jgi:hypothetical protein